METMDVVMIEKKAFDEIVSRIDELKRKSEKIQDPTKVWLDNTELMQLLFISKRTTQLYRDTGIISFSQVGNKIYYRLSDVEEMLQNHYTKGGGKWKALK